MEVECRSLSCFSTALENSTLHLARRGNSHLLALLPQQGDVKPDGKISAQIKKKKSNLGVRERTKLYGKTE